MQVGKGVRFIAMLEAAKGGLVLLAGCGLLALIHYNVQAVAETMVEHFHLNPASRYPRIFLHAADAVTDARLWWLAGGAALYAGLRFIEAYGLWHRRPWAEWLAVVSGGIYIPIEIYELTHHVSWPKLVMLIGNLIIVAYLISVLLQNRRGQKEKE